MQAARLQTQSSMVIIYIHLHSAKKFLDTSEVVQFCPIEIFGIRHLKEADNFDNKFVGIG